MTRPAQGGLTRPRRFDAFGLVARRGEIAGKVDAYDLERVEDWLGDDEGVIPPGEIGYRIIGDTDARARAVLNVALAGTVQLQCQRCLRLFEWPIAQQTTLLLARDEQDLAFLDEHDEREVLLAGAPLDPLEIVEEELVLSLPYVPRCDRPDCLPTDAAVRSDDAPEAATSAFHGLAALKRGVKPPRE